MIGKYFNVEQLTQNASNEGHVGSRYERLMQLIVAWQSVRHIDVNQRRKGARWVSQR